MIKNILILGFLAAGFIACNSEGTGSSSQATVTLDVRCAADTECPTGFECENEVENGVSTSYCVSDDARGTSTGACPAGYELEAEHGGTFCKPHGGNDGTGGSHGGTDDGTGGTDDNAGSTGTAVEGAACQTSADCIVGLECEVQIENGVTTSICQAHGGNTP